jgi:uncharacterized protein YegP (UPF0339 family)
MLDGLREIAEHGVESVQSSYQAAVSRVEKPT